MFPQHYVDSFNHILVCSLVCLDLLEAVDFYVNSIRYACSIEETLLIVCYRHRYACSIEETFPHSRHSEACASEFLVGISFLLAVVYRSWTNSSVLKRVNVMCRISTMLCKASITKMHIGS